MTLLVLADTRFPIERANGVQTMATCHALARRGHAVTLVVRPDTARPPRDPFAFYGLERVPGLTITAIQTSTDVRARRVAFLLGALRLVLSRRPDLVFTRDLGSASMLLRLPSGRPPLVYESHGVAAVVAEEMPRLLGRPDTAPGAAKLRRLDRRDERVWRRAEAYVTITRALADDLAARFGSRERVFVVPDAAASPRTASTPSAGPRVAGGERVAAYAGHLYPWKGVDVFVRALALTPGVRGLIVGGHPQEADRARIDALVAELGLGNRVTITGLLPPSEVGPRLATADLLVLPNTASAISERYTSPLKLFEYLALGQPIVASDLPAIREVLTDGRTAMLVPPDDAQSLAAALTALAADPARASALGAAARALAAEYTWARRAERLEAAFAEAIRR